MTSGGKRRRCRSRSAHAREVTDRRCILAGRAVAIGEPPWFMIAQQRTARQDLPNQEPNRPRARRNTPESAGVSHSLAIK